MKNIVKKIFQPYNFPLIFFSGVLFYELTSEASSLGLISALWKMVITYGLILTFIWSFVCALFKFERSKDRQVFYSLLVPLISILLSLPFNMTKRLVQTMKTITYAERNDNNGIESIRLLSDSSFVRINNDIEASFISKGKFNVKDGRLYLTSQTNKYFERDTFLIEESSIYKLSLKGDTILLFRIIN